MTVKPQDAPPTNVRDAEALRRQGLPWRVRIVSTKGTSDKFWEMYGEGNSGATVRWGRRGSNGQSQTKSWDEARKKCYDKLTANKGYNYCAGTVALGDAERYLQENGHGSSKPELPPLQGPFALIKTLDVQSDGSAHARDSTGAFLFAVSAKGLAMLKHYPQITVW